jgi:hypothetical protein
VSQNITPTELGDGWRVAAPKDQGVDATILSGIGPRFEGWREACAHAVVVARRGALIYEHYFTGNDWCWTEPLGAVAFGTTVKHDLKSITKSVTSLLVGIALDRGWIADINMPVFTYFPDHAELRTPEKDQITLGHLLAMSAGLAWNENLPWDDPANNERRMDDAADPYRYALGATQPKRRDLTGDASARSTAIVNAAFDRQNPAHPARHHRSDRTRGDQTTVVLFAQPSFPARTRNIKANAGAKSP